MTPKEIYPLYFGQKVLHENELKLIIGVNESSVCLKKSASGKGLISIAQFDEVKLILRPIEEIEDKELLALNKHLEWNYLKLSLMRDELLTEPNNIWDSVKLINWLRANGFDCDNLLEFGHAITPIEAQK